MQIKSLTIDIWFYNSVRVEGGGWSMIKQITLVNSLIISMLALASMYSAHVMIAACQLKYRYVLKFDTALTDYAQESIGKAIEQLWPMQQQLPHNIWAELHALFPFLDTCTIAYTAHGCAIIAITAQKPLVKINENTVITCNGLLLEQDYLPADDVPHIHIEEITNSNAQPAIDSVFLAWAQSLDECIHEQYSICWKDKTCIILTEKNDPAATIVCHADQHINQDVLQICTRIKASRKRGQKWKADIRFKDLIIVGERE